MNASRKLDILKYFDVSEVLSVKELAEKLGCSESSVRRDLIALDKQGLIKKVHGGAVRKEADTAVEDKELSVRMALNPDAKKAVGAFAGGLVKEGDTVYLRCYANGSMPLIYQWYKDGVQIERAIEDILVLENVLQGDSGIYTVRVENEDGEVESDPIYLEVGSQEVEPPQLSWSIEEGLLILYYEGILLESEDLLQWNAVEEAAGSTYQIELNQGGSRYYRVVRP